MSPLISVFRGIEAAPLLVPFVLLSYTLIQLEVTVAVVNCAVALLLLPPEQVASTLQSYNVPEERFVKLAELPAWEDSVVQVVPLANL